jgi:hypothetical protein
LSREQITILIGGIWFMKKLLILGLVVLAVLSTSVVAFGLNSPAVSKGGGVITGMFANEDIGLLLGIEYGLSDKFAVSGRVGFDDVDYNKIVLKFEISPTFAIVGGMFEFIGKNEPYFGINGALAFDRDFMGILEAGVIMADDTEMYYEAGIKYNVNKLIDIRGGVIGSTYDNSETAFELGAGYKF